MSDFGPVTETARAIRYYLPRLDLPDPTKLDSQLLQLLNEAQNGRDVELELADVLMRHESTREWAGDFLETGLPAGFPRATKSGYQPLPGRGAPIAAPRYECPVDGLYVWYQRTEQQEVPFCMDHPNRQLIAVG